jgi:hypothetical protein
MHRRLGILIIGGLIGGLIGLGILGGCDHSLGGQDIFSPATDMRVTALDLGNNALSILMPTVGTIPGSNPPATTAAWSEIIMQVTVFDGPSIQLTRLRVEYFRADGVTPLGIDVYTQFLNTFVAGATPAQSDFISINPVQVTTTLIQGNPTRAPVKAQIVSNQLNAFLSGADQTLGTTDDRTDLVVALLTLYGEDINQNDVQTQTRVNIRSGVVLQSLNQ